MRYPFSRLTVLLRFFQDLVLHRLLTQKALKFPDLFQCGGEFRSRNDLFTGSHCGEAAFLVLLFLLEQQNGLNAMQAGTWDIDITGGIDC